MGKGEEFIAAIEAIYAAGLDPELWPKALAGMAAIVGGAAATLELFDKRTLHPGEFYFHGVPPAAEIKYLDHYVALNPRLPIVAHDKLGEMSWDYRIFDERTIRRDPFYMEFLAPLGICYWVGGIIVTNTQEFAGVCVHRSPKQGHIDKAGLALMERFLPHVRGAFDVARRLRGAGEARHALERALDWLADGVALLRIDGTVVYANEAFHAMARGADGLQLKKGKIELLAGEARGHFEAAMAGLHRLRNQDPRDPNRDFSVARSSGGPPFVVSLRPIAGHRRDTRVEARADAILFIRDPMSGGAAAIHMLREMFGVTEAEASLARALQAGVPLGDYARAHAVSRNTVYTHLRRLKEKTGCHRMAELIRKLNDLQAPLLIE